MSDIKDLSTHDLIERARALIIGVSAAAIGAEQVTDNINFQYSPEVQRDILTQANGLLLEASSRTET